MMPSTYVPTRARGARVRIMDDTHRKKGQECTIIGALPNPSQRSEHQWYDVRFDDDSFGRFLEKHLCLVGSTSDADVSLDVA